MDKFFKISERGSNVKTEIIAGLTTFFAMAYIIVVNPNQIVGFSFGVEGIDKIWNAVYIASIIAAVIGTLLYAFYANLPFAQACGMGLNSFFFVSFVLPQIVRGIIMSVRNAGTALRRSVISTLEKFLSMRTPT